MSFEEFGEHDQARLYAVYLGGELAPGRLGEDHEVVFVAAADVPAARSAAKLKWQGTSDPHIDAVRILDLVDGFAVQLLPSDQAEHVFIDNSYVE